MAECQISEIFFSKWTFSWLIFCFDALLNPGKTLGFHPFIHFFEIVFGWIVNLEVLCCTDIMPAVYILKYPLTRGAYLISRNMLAAYIKA